MARSKTCGADRASPPEGNGLTAGSARLQELFHRRQAGAKFSMDGIRRLCAALGHPEKRLCFVHIAGTNGKGSVAAMCAAIFQHAGLRTALYTSPHLWRYHERFRLNGTEMTDAELDPLLERVMSEAGDATFFEISTALALCWFCAREAEIVVWETGLGGRLDATNVVTPVVCAITHIGLEHTQFLGETLAQIAKEKAGIIKPGIPAATVSQDEVVMTVLRKRAQQQGASLRVIAETDLDEFVSPLAGGHQQWNTALAVAAARQTWPSLSDRIIREGLKKTTWPGRCQLIERKNGLPPVLVDGAHNPLGATALAREIERRWGRGKVVLIFGALADKEIAGMSALLSAVAAEVLLAPVRSERAASMEALSRHFPEGRVCASLQEALAIAERQGRPMVIAGSLFLAGEALALLEGRTSAAHPNERF